MLVGDAESWGGWSRGRDIQKHSVPSAQTGHIPIIAFNNKVYFKSVCVCVCVCPHAACAHVHVVQHRCLWRPEVLDPRKLLVSYLLGVLGTELRSSARVVCVLHC